MRSEDYNEVIEFCLDHAELAPVHRRVKLYRGLAEFCADTHLKQQFLQMAGRLESADAQCREFAFKFREGGRR